MKTVKTANKQVVPRTAEKDASGEIKQQIQQAATNCYHTKEITKQVSLPAGNDKQIKDVIQPVGGD